MNHFSTRSMRSCGVVPSEIAAKSNGCSHQYAGNSVNDTGDRMTGHQRRVSAREFNIDLQGGAVMDDKSEVMLASDLMKLAHPAFCS